MLRTILLATIFPGIAARFPERRPKYSDFGQKPSEIDAQKLKLAAKFAEAGNRSRRWTKPGRFILTISWRKFPGHTLVISALAFNNLARYIRHLTIEVAQLMSSLLSRRSRVLPYLVLFCFSAPLSLFAIRGVFQGRVVEGTKRESGKYIYVAGPNGYLRRVNIQKCRVRFGDGVSAGDRIHSAADYLRQDAEIRVTADQAENGEWVAVEVLILKLPAIDKASLHT